MQMESRIIHNLGKGNQLNEGIIPGQKYNSLADFLPALFSQHMKDLATNKMSDAMDMSLSSSIEGVFDAKDGKKQLQDSIKMIDNMKKALNDIQGDLKDALSEF